MSERDRLKILDYFDCLGDTEEEKKLRIRWVREMKAENAELRAKLVAAPPPAVPDALRADDIEWIVNDNSELGVKIRNQFFFLYKGYSLVYETGRHDDESEMMWRPVGKREFGECCHPIHLTQYPDMYTEGTGWQPLPLALRRYPDAPPPGDSGLREIIEWALGCGDDFPERKGGDGLYWWRKELTKRYHAALGRPAETPPASEPRP
jgi:hypothetical protein